MSRRPASTRDRGDLGVSARACFVSCAVAGVGDSRARTFVRPLHSSAPVADVEMGSVRLARWRGASETSRSRRVAARRLLLRARTQRRVNRGLLFVPRPPRARRWGVWCGSSARGSRPNRIARVRFRSVCARGSRVLRSRSWCGGSPTSSFLPQIRSIRGHDAPRWTVARRSPSFFSSRAREAMPPPRRRRRHLRSPRCRPCRRHRRRRPPRRPRRRFRLLRLLRPLRPPRGSSGRTSRRSRRARC